MNNWTWDRLRVFNAVAHTGSVTAAARALHMTGPAVSQHLHRLEAEVGASLVARVGRGIRLTHEGVVLAEHARALAAIVQQAEHDLAEHERELRGTIRIGAISSAIRGLLLAPLHEFTCRHPKVRVQLRDGEAVDHLRRLHEHDLDVVIAESWHNHPSPMPRGVQPTRLLTERARLVVPEGHVLAERDKVAFRELGGQAWTCCPPGSDAHTALCQFARHAGVELEVAYTVADHTTQIDLVAAGLAFACIPELSLPKCLNGVRVVDTDPVLTRSVDVVVRTGPLPLHVNEFVSDLGQACRAG
ncbi:LysR family transcriptional regulator [Kutzneria albida]|uniref:HTH lysR-type domain-containing protein n=1 Tax=Kutzneria albida DSM 43870 TaxID=1449976 RepID=W5WM32_9PSEU|nr:LysR family transcriptional regulator [Kutzneria albida]AHH99214.1 hypothetical protein KALB_5853 [Kutzneria albida DSM 43870]